MGESERAYRIEVLAGGDPLREERLTRSLRDDLASLEGVSVDLAQGGASTPGSKSGVLTDLALIAVSAGAGMASSRSLARLLTTAITEWCRKERHRKVRITRGDDTLEITGNPDKGQQRLVQKFMQSAEDDE
ncbi:hypothetical protein ACWDKQ_33700 [Saccharopolyspora sp. NPDC000995]